MVRTVMLSALMAVALATPAAFGEKVHITHCAAGCPTGTPETNELLVRNLFAASINRQTRVADWISYRILDSTLGVASLLSREWSDDPLVYGGLQSASLVGPGTVVRQPNLENQQDQAYRITEFQISPGDRGHLVHRFG